MVELVDTLDSKSGEHYARAGSSPARGTKIDYMILLDPWNENSVDLFCKNP